MIGKNELENGNGGELNHFTSGKREISGLLRVDVIQ